MCVGLQSFWLIAGDADIVQIVVIDDFAAELRDNCCFSAAVHHRASIVAQPYPADPFRLPFVLM